ncbi:MAG: BCD family MFS transporter [Anaerolineales bacterium]|nr:BCD family MFS transporter [Anaerolineales bacterium]
MNWRKILQFTLVHVGVAMTAVPVNSTLNRVMITELNFSALLVGFLISLPYLLSPLQVFVGNWADHNPVWGRRRSPWILMGGLMATFGSYLTAHAVYLMADNFGLGLVAAIGAFTLWGVGVNIASVSYLSLLSEETEGKTGWRSRAISVMWTTMILVSIFTGIALSRMLEDYSPTTLYTAFGFIWLIASTLVMFGSAGIEPRMTAETVHRHADNPGTAMRALVNNPTAKRFFLYLTLVLISVHAQDILLEPFGGDVLGMSVAATSRLISIWGVGVFVTMIGGLWVVRRLGKKTAANLGAFLSATGFALIIMTGALQQVNAFMGAVFILGLGGGLMTVSNLSFMLDMTVPEAAGLYIGAWGVANFAGQAIGNIASGLIRDVALRLTGSEFVGYITVFSLEIVGLMVAVWLFRSISVQNFRRDAEVQLPELLAVAVD